MMNTERITIMWEITLKCNLTCHFCLSWERRRKNYSNISFEDAKNIVSNLPENWHISFVWWECFLFPNFIEILKLLEKRWLTFEITTNWTLVRKNLKDLNQLNNLTNIYFSIDKYWEQHDKIRWKKWVFNEIIEVIPLIKNKVYINTVILESTTSEEILKLYKLFLKKNIYHLRLAYYTNFSLEDIGNSIKKVNDIEIDMKFESWIDNINLRKKTILLYKKLNIINEKLGKKINIDLNPISILRWYPKSCKSLNKYYRINEKGNLTICHFINNEFDSLINNNFEKIIKNIQFVNLRNKINKSFPLDICKNCWKWI